MKILVGLSFGFLLAFRGSCSPAVLSVDPRQTSDQSHGNNSSQVESSLSLNESQTYKPDGNLELKDISEENPDVDSNSTRYYVFAHVVQGNAQNYTKEQWEADMKVAQDANIDAFAINIGTDLTNDNQLPIIYDVAEEVGFKVFISFDMNYYAYNGSSKDIIARTLQFSNRESQFKYKGKVFLSTFSGEVPGTFMNGNPNYTSAWCSLKASLRGHGVDTYFVPGWTGIEPSTSRCADGLLSWDAWPHVSNDIPSSDDLTYNVTVQENMYFPDKAAMEAARAVSKSFMAPVSPLFFKHLDSETDNNYIYRSDDWMMVNRYTKLIKQKQKPEFIELLTWNDYGESHYLRDPQPSANLPAGTVSAHQYVDGYSHAALLDMLSYFNRWYKNGKPPVLEKTTVYVWYRPHTKTSTASADKLPIPAYANLTEDRIYGYVIPAPNTTVASIRLLSGYQVLEQPLFQPNSTLHQNSKNSSDLCQIYEDRSNNNEAEVDGTGILVSAPFEPGNQLIELLDKSGQTLASLQGLEVQVMPETYNFNYWSASVSV